MYWPAYRTWLASKGVTYVTDLNTAQDALKYFMPEMLPTYERLCELASADKLAARFLTGYQPPAFISGCSQAVLTAGAVQLVRNYDYHPNLIEGAQLLTAWNRKKVIGTSDCLAGLLDGMNEDGLVVSLTFGGRKEVGKGFGIPFILRYVLEFCSNVEEAVEVLVRVPSHMSYNVTVLDKTGAFKTVQLAPDKAPLVTDADFTTNHQRKVDWPENALFNRTVERAAFLENWLSDNKHDPEKLVDAFMRWPLYNTNFAEGFGTLYTVDYRPVEGTVQLRWPRYAVMQSFDDFQEQYQLISFDQPKPNIAPMPVSTLEQEVASIDQVQQQPTSVLKKKEHSKSLRQTILRRGHISWEILSGYWANVGKKYWEKWWK